MDLTPYVCMHDLRKIFCCLVQSKLLDRFQKMRCRWIRSDLVFKAIVHHKKFSMRTSDVVT